MHSSVSDPPPRKPWVGVLLLAAFALVEVGLAAWVVVLGGQGSCPLSDSGFSCAALVRPRLGQLGPLSLAHLAVAGGLASLAFTQLAALRPLSAPLARWGPTVLSAGAGFALAVQAWSAAAVGALCPFCLGIALSACGVAAAAVGVAWRERRQSPRSAATGFALTLALGLPLAWLHGAGIAEDDAARRANVLAAGGERGPRLLLVVKDGCPFCEAMLVDTLGDPRVLERLAETRGVSLVRPDDPRLEGVALEGTPTLLAPDANLPPLAGLASPEQVLAWLAARER